MSFRVLGTLLLLLTVSLVCAILWVHRPQTSVDLSGTYDTATLTPLERSPGFGTKLAVPPSSEAHARLTVSSSPAERSLESYSNADGSPPLKIDGMLRTSIIVRPDDGRLPRFSEEGEKRFRQSLQAVRSRSEGVWWLDQPAGPFDGPEDRPLQERCLLDGVGSAGPPALPAGYNNIKRIVQTDDSVLIVNEMIHDARVIRLNGTHVPPSIRRWLGDSIGWWEGDTLVVETTNFRERTGLFKGGASLKVMEWFQRIDEHGLLYRFRVEDSSTWAESWEGEYVWRSTDQRMYEYACHEGNYSLPGVLKGARESEAQVLQESMGSVAPPPTEDEGVSPPGTDRKSSSPSDFRNASKARE